MQSLGGAITWLSGAAAGLAAILYAFGYLVSMAHARMLGLELGSLRYDYTFYLQRGGSFFLMMIAETAPYLFLELVLILVAIGAVAGWRWYRAGAPAEGVLSRLGGFNIGWRAIAYTGLVVLLALQISTHLAYPEWMTVTGILLDAGKAEAPSGSVRQWILTGDETLLRNQFTYLANQQVWIGILLILAWCLARTWRWGFLLIAPFALVFVTSTFYIALEYGTLSLPVKFREASAPVEYPSAKMYLLHQIDSGYVLWDAGHRQTRWVTMDKRIDLSGYRTIAQILRSSEAGEP